MRTSITKPGFTCIVFIGISIAALSLGTHNSYCSSEDNEVKFIFQLSFSSLLKLYECSLINDNFHDQLFALTGIIKLYKSSYNSNLKSKFVTSTDAGLAYARRWMIYEKIGESSNAEYDFSMSKNLLEKKYGKITKKSLSRLIDDIDNQPCN